MNNSTTLRLAGLASFASLALLTACGGGGGSSSGVSADSGTLKVSMTDAPACGFDKVNVSVTKFRVHKSSTATDTDSGWSEITINPAKKIDLLSLRNGIVTELGQTALPAGHYTQMRLVLAENASGALANSVVAEGSTTEVALDVPSGTQSGIKLTNEFDIAANAATELVLDFDACKSIVTKGNGNGGFLLKPVISVTPKITSGQISGFVPTGLTKPTVSVQSNGAVIKSTVPDSTGAFTLSPVPASTSYVVVITADGRTTAAITGVPVTVGATTNLSTSAAPIALPVAATATASGTVSPASALGTVRATQVLGTGGATIEVASKAADSTTGAYTLTLPTVAPLVGKFGALPIALAADTTATVAGKYTLEASATGFTKKTTDIDVSKANATANFTLTP